MRLAPPENRETPCPKLHVNMENMEPLTASGTKWHSSQVPKITKKLTSKHFILISIGSTVGGMEVLG